MSYLQHGELSRAWGAVGGLVTPHTEATVSYHCVTERQRQGDLLEALLLRNFPNQLRKLTTMLLFLPLRSKASQNWFFRERNSRTYYSCMASAAKKFARNCFFPFPLLRLLNFKCPAIPFNKYCKYLVASGVMTRVGLKLSIIRAIGCH